MGGDLFSEPNVLTHLADQYNWGFYTPGLNRLCCYLYMYNCGVTHRTAAKGIQYFFRLLSDELDWGVGQCTSLLQY